MYSFNSGTSDKSTKSVIENLEKIKKENSIYPNIYVEKIKKIAQYIFDEKLITIVGENHIDNTKCLYNNTKDIIGLYKLLKKPIVIAEALKGSYNFDKIKENIKKYHHVNVRKLISKDFITLYYDKQLHKCSLNYIYNKFMIPLRTFLRKQINLEKTKLKLFTDLSYPKEIYFSQLFMSYYNTHLNELERCINFFENNYLDNKLSTRYNKILLDISLENTGKDTSDNTIRLLRYIYAFMEDVLYIKTIVNSKDSNFMIVCGSLHYMNIVRFLSNLKCKKLFKKSSSNNCLRINNMLAPISPIEKSKSKSKSNNSTKSNDSIKNRMSKSNENKNKRPISQNRLSIKKIKTKKHN